MHTKEASANSPGPIMAHYDAAAGIVAGRRSIARALGCHAAHVPVSLRGALAPERTVAAARSRQNRSLGGAMRSRRASTNLLGARQTVHVRGC